MYKKIYKKTEKDIYEAYKKRLLASYTNKGVFWGLAPRKT